MRLTFTVRPGLRVVEGVEQITFTPDRPITELVFRLTANTVSSASAGSQVVVSAATSDHSRGHFTFTRAAADPHTEGGLLHIPLAGTVAAGTPVSARLAFTLHLGAATFDRFGSTGTYAWFGSGEPLLSWQRGYGWHTEDLANVLGESATSEAMDVQLAVTAPAAETVLMSGDPTSPGPAQGGMRTWTAALDGARDVSVALGPFLVRDDVVDGVQVRVGAYSAGVRDALLPLVRLALRGLAARYGPFPFPSLSLARLPLQGGGIEYPGSILLFDSYRVVVVHETAHQYFYAMVGDSQALHPWLDEAFATFAEQLVDDTPESSEFLQLPGRVDSPISAFHADLPYDTLVYAKGAAALQAARAAAGPVRFDAALRCYVARNAWRIAVPTDVARALAAYPRAIAVLRRAGALE
jgi:hypothetical protein